MKIDELLKRRDFLTGLVSSAGVIVLLPQVTACSTGATRGQVIVANGILDVPVVKPVDWDPIAFNRDRGNQGAIPESYRGSINGPDGEMKHLGKHLPYVVDATASPEGYMPLMWGDPSKGYARHPNAVPGADNNHEGHWYNWIRVRKAIDGDAEELESAFTSWPAAKVGDTGRYLTLGGGDRIADGGRNTIYLVAIPDEIERGDTVRVWSHCLTHGEYVDFITV